MINLKVELNGKLNVLISFRNAVFDVVTKSEFIRRQGERFSCISDRIGCNFGP